MTETAHVQRLARNILADLSDEFGPDVDVWLSAHTTYRLTIDIWPLAESLSYQLNENGDLIKAEQ